MAEPVVTPSTRAGEAPPVVPPAATPPPGGAPPPSGGGKWQDSLDADTRSFVETKGYKEISDVVKAQKSLETLLGGPRERLLKLPEKNDDPAWADVHKRLGKPDKAEEYTVPLGADGKPDAFGQWARENFHKANLSKAQAEVLLSQFAEFQKTQKAAGDEAFKGNLDQQLAKLKEEWGAAYQQNADIVNKICGPQGLNLTEDQYHRGEGAFGVDGWAKFVHSLSSKFGIKVEEAPFLKGDGTGAGGSGAGNGAMTPESATARLKFLEKDTEFTKKLGMGDVNAIEELTRLHKYAHPGNIAV